MKKIGFIDLYISEWHANNYPAWIKGVCKEKGLDYEVAYAWAEQDVSAVDGKTTDAWCTENGIEKCNTIEELCEKSDYIVILAPSNPEVHLKYAEIALKYKKRTYIDKTFAPDFNTAKAIFDIANAYGTPFFSTSALRYATELAPVEKKCSTITVTGSGASFDEYGIHVIEMCVKTMGIGAKAVRAEKAGDQYLMRIDYKNGKFANIVFDGNYGTPFTIMPCGEDGKTVWKLVESDSFKGLMTAILNFFEDGKLPFDTNETLEVMKVRDALIKATTKTGKWIKVK